MEKVLFISPLFFNYAQIMTDAIRKKGFEVTWFNDRPNNNFWTKVFVRLNKKLIHKKIQKHFDNIKKVAQENDFDYVFVLYGQSLSSYMIDELREILPKAKFIFYMWDPIDFCKDRAEFSTHFDKCFTFDDKDVEKYDNFEFLPLYYYDTQIDNIEIKYDCSFIGTIKKGKLPFVLKLQNLLNKKYENNMFYLYIQSKLVYLYNKIFNKEFKNSRMKDFKYKKLSFEENKNMVLSSNIVLDCPMANQNGLSMRTFECLAYHKKMITTNPNVLNYDFYREENIYYFDGETIDFDNVFFNSDYVVLDEEIVKKYSIEHWVEVIFGMEK